jgi:CheY-like chemotaxis protein
MFDTILIVDDDPIQTEILASFFQSLAGVRTATAHDGRHARELAKSLPELAMIVCDLNMPDTDGVEFIEDLADRECRLPIILISGAERRVYKAAQGLAVARRLRLVGSMRKPVDFGELRRLVTPHIPTVVAGSCPASFE